jgi:hypothetical protein
MKPFLHEKSKSTKACQFFHGDEVIAQIAKDRGIKIIDHALWSEEKIIDIYGSLDWITNSSSSAGRDEIFLGIYEDKELRLISFFHELGHTMLGDEGVYEYNKYEIKFHAEIECWRIGLKYAQDLGIYFSSGALKWAYEQALSYIGYEEREYVTYDRNHSE